MKINYVLDKSCRNGFVKVQFEYISAGSKFVFLRMERHIRQDLVHRFRKVTYQY